MLEDWCKEMCSTFVLGVRTSNVNSTDSAHCFPFLPSTFTVARVFVAQISATYAVANPKHAPNLISRRVMHIELSALNLLAQRAEHRRHLVSVVPGFSASSLRHLTQSSATALPRRQGTRWTPAVEQLLAGTNSMLACHWRSTSNNGTA